MKMRIRSYITAIAIAASAQAIAQDFHITQYETAPMYLNPALTGMYFGEKGDFKISANYRSQWRSLVKKPFVTANLGYDMPYKRFGFGAYIIDNKAGTGGFGTLNFMLSGAYNIMKDETGKQNLTAGLQMGILYKSFNLSKFTFDSQYSTSAQGGFDTGIDPGERFDRTGIVRLDAALGVFYKYRDESKKANPFAGLAVYHVTKPDESFTGYESRLPMRFVFHGGSDIQVNEKLKLVPGLLFMSQAKATEINVNALGYYKIKETDYDVIFGLGYRHKDAMMLQLGMKQKENVFRVSYDINTSYLNNFTGSRGGIEFSLIYTGSRKVQTKSFL
jgi:type IX secretion system PorP/SprF family membrane protein